MKPQSTDPAKYADAIILLMKSGNVRVQAQAELMIHALSIYFFKMDPQFKEKA